MRVRMWQALTAGCLSLVLAAPAARGEEIPAEFRKTVRDGLDWIIKNQNRDGHWEAVGGQYPMTMTGICGMTLLMEGSTLREGKYRDNIRRAVDYLMARSQPKGSPQDGMLGHPNIPGESGRYMYGHGFALLFLSCAYGEEEEGEKRRKLEDILVRACKFSRDAQTKRKAKDGKTDIGGWGYVSAKDGSNFDEGSVTITQVQALRAARNAGVAVPSEAITEAVNYLRESTNPQGGVIYSLAGGGGGDGRPALTAAAISCGFSAGDYNSTLVRSWFAFCKTHVPALGNGRFGHDEYTHYYYAQSMYMLGDEGWGKLFPKEDQKDWLTWSKYRKGTFDYLKRTQGGDGSWTGGHVGPVFITAVHLTILQLDKAVLPIYQR